MKAVKTREIISKLNANKIFYKELDELERLAEIGEAVELAIDVGMAWVSNPVGLDMNVQPFDLDYLLKWYRSQQPTE